MLASTNTSNIFVRRRLDWNGTSLWNKNRNARTKESLSLKMWIRGKRQYKRNGRKGTYKNVTKNKIHNSVRREHLCCLSWLVKWHHFFIIRHFAPAYTNAYRCVEIGLCLICLLFFSFYGASFECVLLYCCSTTTKRLYVPAVKWNLFLLMLSFDTTQ